MSASQIRVLCADDHPLILEGIAPSIERVPDMLLVGEATTEKKLSQHSRSTHLTSRSSICRCLG